MDGQMVADAYAYNPVCCMCLHIRRW